MRALLRRAGPLSVLAACMFPIVGALPIHSARHGLVATVPVVVVLLLCVVDWRATLRRAALGVVAAATIGLSTWLYGDHDLDVAAGASLRILYLVLPGAVLTAYLDPLRLGDHLAQRLRLPHRPVVASTVALQRLDVIGADWEQIGRARRSRGLGAGKGLVDRARAVAAMTFALLVSSLRAAGPTSLAMDARGFATAHRRTWAEPAPWTAADWAVLALAAALALLPWLTR